MKKRLFALLLSLTSVVTFAAVDVNKASEADLDSIKGIGPGTSSKIIEQRKAAPFKSWGDLMTRVSGIGAKRAASLSEQGLTVNGETFKPNASANTNPSTAKPKQ
jgi:competence protein ComEA